MRGHRFVAAIYDRFLAASERAGLADMRSELIDTATGRVLEVGAGTGLNLGHYPPAVTELVLTEPDPFMARRLRSRLAELAPPFATEVVECPAERLEVEDAGFDTVVSTLALCTIGDPERAAAEIARVLRPGGRLLVLEHVRSPDSERLARWQDRLERPWGWVAGGCHPNRDTAAMLAEVGFTPQSLERGRLPKALPHVEPLIRGSFLPPDG